MTQAAQATWSDPGVEEILPGVHRIPLPLPGDGLKAVNVYALDDGDGLTMIDGGWALDRSQAVLEEGLASIGHDLGDIRQFLVTHIHRDHYELASVIGRKLGARVALGIGERPSLESLRKMEHDPTRAPLLGRLQAAGAHKLIEELEALRRLAPESVAKVDWQLPDVWLEHRQLIELADRRLEVLATPGHTKGHVVFVDHDAGLLFAGDHILPHITPSIGFEQVPQKSALADYLVSLALVRGLDDLRMLPAHGPVRPTTHDRIDALLAHHDHRLAVMQEAVAAGAETAFEVARAVPWTSRDRAFDDLDVFNRMLAVNETIAHLDVLVARDRLSMAVDDQGIRRFVA